MFNLIEGIHLHMPQAFSFANQQVLRVRQVASKVETQPDLILFQGDVDQPFEH